VIDSLLASTGTTAAPVSVVGQIAQSQLGGNLEALPIWLIFKPKTTT
jgi:hypothetical protein